MNATTNALLITPIFVFINKKSAVMGMIVPRTKLGTVVATVALRLEPKSSAATVMKSVQ